MTTKARRPTAATDLSGHHALAKRPSSGTPIPRRPTGRSARRVAQLPAPSECHSSPLWPSARRRALRTSTRGASTHYQIGPSRHVIPVHSGRARKLGKGGDGEATRLTSAQYAPVPEPHHPNWTRRRLHSRKPASGAGPASVHRVLHMLVDSLLARCPCLRRSAAGWLRFEPPSRRHRTRGCRGRRTRTGRRFRATTTDRRRRPTAGPQSRRGCRR